VTKHRLLQQGAAQTILIYVTDIAQISVIYNRGVQIPGAVSPGRINFVPDDEIYSWDPSMEPTATFYDPL
jgi:hypothetical protein